MRQPWKRPFTDERGATLVVVAACLVALLGAAAIAVDLGMLYDARTEAQRAADAGALAGASTFLSNVVRTRVAAEAQARAQDYARRNPVHGRDVPADATGIEVVVDEGIVRFRVTGRAIPLWFARVTGRTQTSVEGRATARAIQSGSAECIKPLMIPDWWVDDRPSNGRFDPGEFYDPLVTGYGMTYRDPGQPGYASVRSQGDFWRDFGRPVLLKAGSPSRAMEPGWFFPIRLPGATGASDYRDALSSSCPPVTLSIGDEIYSEPGNMIGPTKQAITDAISMDPDARWVAGVGIQGSRFGGGTGEGSPRMITIPFFAPTQQVPSGTSSPFTITNFGTFFVEAMQGNDIVGRWTRVRSVRDNCQQRNNCRPYLQTLRLTN
jgi:hypothetical protein